MGLAEWIHLIKRNCAYLQNIWSEEKSYNNKTTNEISLSFKFYNNEDAMLIYLQRKKETKALQQLQLPSTFRAIPSTHRFDFFQR